MKNAWSIFIVLFALLLLSSHAYSQGRFTVTVTVVNDSGDPIPGASVNIVKVSGERNERFNGTSDGSGVARIKVETIFGGSFEVRVDKPLFLQGKAGFTAAGNSRDKDMNIEVALSANAAATEILVHVTDQATNYTVNGASVTLTGRLSASAYQSGSTDSNGDARFYLNSSGSYTIRVSSSIFEAFETPVIVNEGQKNVSLSVALKKKYAKPRMNAEFVAIVKGKDADGKIIPIKGARVQVVDQNSMADTDDRGTAFLKAEAGIGDEIRIAVAANGYQPQEKIAQMNADTVGGAGGILSIGGGAQFMLERIPASAIYLTVEVRDANTNKGLYAAEVRVRSKSTGAEVYAALTNEDGGTDKLEIPVEKAAQGLQVRVKANNYEEKWSDIAPELVTIGERRYSVFLSPACRLAGTWAFNVPALGSSTFVIDSKGTTRESGMGSSTGTTVLSGRTLTYTWTTVYGYDGNVVIDLNESCTEGRGKVTWTKYPPTEKRGSTFPATLTRRN